MEHTVRIESLKKNDYSSIFVESDNPVDFDKVADSIDSSTYSDVNVPYQNGISSDNNPDESNQKSTNELFAEDIELNDSSGSMSDRYLSEWYNLAPTTSMSFSELVGDNGIYTYPEGFPAPGTYKIIVDLKYQVVMAFTTDTEGKYTVPVRYMLCSTGASKSPTPTGTFIMPSYRVRFALFKDTNVYGQYWSQITGRIYFHSVLYSEMDASTYTESSYMNLGTKVSHGCIRLSVPDARWIWYNVAPGSEVEIRKGSSSDSDTASIRSMLTLAALPKERINISSDNLPNTDNWQIDNVSHEVTFVQGSQ